MKKKQSHLSKKGITLIALVLTVVVLLILSSITINIGFNTIKEGKYYKAVSELRILQTQVNDLYANYSDDYEGDTNQLSSELRNKAYTSYNTAKNNNKTEKDIGNFEDYKYYTAEQISKELGVEDVESDYLINVKARTVISVDGLKQNGETYYSLNEIDDEQYNVEYINAILKIVNLEDEYKIRNNTAIKIKADVELDEGNKDLLIFEYAWTTSKDTKPTTWQTFTLDNENKAQLESQNINSEGSYYLWTKISKKDSPDTVVNTQTSKEVKVKEATNEVNYAVVHKKMKLDGETYETAETENLTELPETVVKPKTKEYEGFTAPERQNVKVLANGTASVTYNYSRNKYQFTLTPVDGISYTGSSSSGQKYFGAEITLKATVEPGYTFGEWQCNVENLIANNTQTETTFQMPSRDVQITVSKTINTYTIQYNLDGGALQNLNPTSYNVNTNTFTLNNPTKEGYQFAGWTGSNGNTPQVEVTIPQGTTGNLTYTANWQTNANQTYELESGTDFKNRITAQTTEVIFTDVEAPTGVTKTDVSKEHDGSVVAWMVGTKMYVSTQMQGQKIILDSDCKDMFYNKTSITNIDFTNVDTSNIENMQQMFCGCSNLESLNLEEFDLTNVTNVQDMLTGNAKIRSIKTPKIYFTADLTIDLPKMMVDSSDNEYTDITKITPINSWLYIKVRYNFYSNLNGGGGSLPEGYHEVGYIESTKSDLQMINTGVPGNNNNLSFEIQYSLTTLPTGWSNIFASYTNEDTNATRLLLNANAAGTYYTLNSKAGGGSGVLAFNKTIDTIYTEKIWPNNSDTFTFSSTGTNLTQTRARVAGYEQTNTIYLLNSGQNTKVYYFKIFDNGVLIRDYVPCITIINGSTISGLFDRANNIFYRATNNKNFLYGELKGDEVQYYGIGETKRLRKNDFEKDGYTFMGWNTKQDGTGTSYSDEELITNTQETEVCLYAQWEDKVCPNVELTKETYIEGFDGWELIGGAYIDEEGALNYTNENAASQSRLYPNAKEYWYYTCDAYTIEPSEQFAPKGGMLMGYLCYDPNANQIKNNQGINIAGHAIPLLINEWTHVNIYNTIVRPDSALYGENIEYISIRSSNPEVDGWGKFPLKLKNFKVRGHLWSTFYDIFIATEDRGTGIKVKKYAVGEKDAEYFKTNGTVFTDSSIRVTENGIYSIYVEDNNKNVTLQTIEIDRIDKTAPTTTKPDIIEEPKKIIVTNKQQDPECGIVKVQYAIKKAGEQYGEWQDSNEFTNLEPNTTYFVKTKSANGLYVETESAEEEIYTDFITIDAIFLPGTTVNEKMKQLSGDENPTYDTINTSIKAVKRSNILPNQYENENNIVSTESSDVPIYMWYDSTDETIYYYTAAESPRANVTSSYMFSKLEEATEIDVATLDTSDTIYIQALFANCLKLETADVSNFKTSKVVYMTSMFNNCKKLDTIDLSNFDTSNVVSFAYMFYNCESVEELDVDEFITEKATNMAGMFYGCQSIESIDVKNFDTSKVTDMRYFCYWCNNLKNIDLSSFNTENVENMIGMFYNCQTLTDIDFSNFNTAKVKNLRQLISNCYSLTSVDFSSFDTSNVEDMWQMVANCSNLTTIYASENFVVDQFVQNVDAFGNVSDSVDMFNNSTKLVGGAGTVYNSSNVDKSYAHIDGGPSNPGYFTGKPVKITFNSNTGTFDNEETTNVAKFSGLNVIQGTYKVPTKQGYILIQWNTEANGTGTGYTFEQLNTITEDTTLYAIYGESYRITYEGNGGTHLQNNNLVAKYDGVYNTLSGHSSTTTTLSDLSGNDRNGTMTDVTIGDNYLEFNGTSSWVNLGVMNSDYMTLETTFSIDEVPSDNGYLITNINSSGGGIFIRPSREIVGMFYINENYQKVVSQTIVELGKTYHVAATYDGNTVKLYVNGVQEGTPIQVSGIIKSSSSTVMALGVNPTLSTIQGEQFKGKIYNAAIFNTALTAEQVAQDAGKEVSYEGIYGTLPTPERAGYSFNGWYTAPTGGTQVQNSTQVTKITEHSLYARWNVASYSVEFNSNGGSGTMETETGFVYEVEKNLSENTFTKKGYTFAGWAKSQERANSGTVDYTNGQAVKNVTPIPNGTATLYAVWTANSYTLTADAVGGTIPETQGWTNASGNETASKTITFDSPYGTIPTPIREGATFERWIGNIFNKDDTPEIVGKYIVGNGGTATLDEYSIYKIDVKPNTTYTLTNSGGSTSPGYVIYNAEGQRLAGENYDNRAIITFTTPATATYIRVSVVTKTDSWRYDKDKFKLECAITSEDIVKTAKDNIIRAEWTVAYYVVTLDANGGSVEPQSIPVFLDTEYGELPTPTRNDYTFVGWSGKNLFNKEKAPVMQNAFIYGDGAVESMYGFSIYQIDVKPNTTYTITNSGGAYRPGYAIFNLDGTRIGGSNFNYKSTVTFTTPATASYIRFSVGTNSGATSYDLDTFQIEEGDQKTDYDPYFVTSSTTVKIPSNHTLHAVWDKCNITFDPGEGGSVSPTSKTVPYDETYGTLPTPTKAGYSFEDWYTAPTGGTKVESTTPVTKISDHTIYAHWTPNAYKATYIGNGGTHLKNNNLIAKYDGYYNAGGSHNASTTVWKDISENGKDGFVTNGIWGDDYLEFNGTSTWVNLGQINNDYQTLEATFSISENPTDQQVIIGNFHTGGGALQINTERKIIGTYYINGEYRVISSTTTVELGKKYHIVLTYDGTKEILYVNGVEDGTPVSISGVIKAPDESTVMVLGGNPGKNAIQSSDSRRFKGKIYNAAVYNTALTAQQIATDAGLTVTYDSTYGTLPTPQRSGYTFNGWYTALTGGTQVQSTTKVTNTSDHTLYARWTENTKKLTVNPNGGTYNSEATNTEYTKLEGTDYGLSTAEKTGYSVSNWNLTGEGSILRGNDSGKAEIITTQFTETERTDTDGSKYTNYKYTNLSVTQDVWPYLRYPHYSFTEGHTYRISVYIRVNSRSGSGYLELRHAAEINDYASTGRVARRIPTLATGQGWIKYTMDRTWTGTTIDEFDLNTNVAINPLFEIYTSVPANTTGSIDFDVKNLVIEDITAGTQISTDTYGGFIYKYGTSDGTVTANWGPNNYRVMFQGNVPTQLQNANLVAKYDGYYNTLSGHSSNTTTLSDLSGNNKNGTMADVTIGEDYLEFNGTSSWVNFGKINNDYQTLEATFSIDETPSQNGYIIGNWEQGGGGIYVCTDKKIRGSYFIDGSYRIIESTKKVELGKKYHVALTYDGTTEILYVNGVQDGTPIQISGTIEIPQSNTVMALGVNPITNEIQHSQFKGKIYNGAIYDNALTPEQIAQDAGKTVIYTNTYGTLPTPQRVNYTFAGWYTAPTEGTEITSESTVTIASDHTLYARWTPIYYQNTNTGAYYETLSSAFANVENGETIRVINSRTETTEPILASGKTVTLDQNGETTILDGVTLTNNGTLTISGGGTLTTASNVNLINNTGILNLANTGTISNTSTGNSHTINNSGTVNKTGTGTVSSATSGRAINGGNITISNGTVSTSGGIGIYSNGTFLMSGGTVFSSYGGAVYVGGNTVNVTGGTIQKSLDEENNYHKGATFSYYGVGTATLSGGTIETISGNSSAIYNESTGTLVVSGATVINSGLGNGGTNAGTGTLRVTSGSITSAESSGLENLINGTIDVTGGSISGLNGICNTGNGQINITGTQTNINGSLRTGIIGGTGIVNISGGIIYGENYGVRVKTEEGVSGIATITGGNITGQVNGINVEGSATLTMGTDDSSVSIIEPIVQSTGTTTGVGVFIEETTGTFNFYDGKIISNSGNTINKEVSDKPDGYEIVKTNADGKETAVLRPTYRVNYQGVGATHQLNNNLVAKYDGYYNNSFNHLSTTTTWTDISGNNRDGIVTNGTWGEDYLEFNGTSSWVNLGEMNSDYMTLETTFSVNQLPTEQQCILGNCETGGGLINIYSNNKIYGQYYINGEYRKIGSDTTIEVGKKYHVALTYDGTIMKLYINGVQDGTPIQVSGTIEPPQYNTVMAIGANPSAQRDSGDYFKGKIYNAAIYSTALPAEQVAQDAGKTVTYASTYGTLPTPQRAGCIFDGWYMSPTWENKVESTTQVTTTSDHTLYAHWIQNNYQNNYQNITTETYYETLADALNEVQNNQTIKVLKNVTESTAPSVPAGKILTLDLNGKTTTLNNVSLTNAGTLTITGSGTLTTSTGVNLIQNSGILNLNHSETISNTNTGEYNTIVNTGTVNHTGSGTTSSASTAGYVVNGGTINVSNGTILTTGYRAIYTTGSFNITSGKVRSEKAVAVVVEGSGTATVSGGTIEKDKDSGGVWTDGECLQINGNATATLSGGTLQNFSGNSSNVIYNNSARDLIIDGATVQNLGSVRAGSNVSTGKIVVRSGTVTSNGGYALANEGTTGSIEVTGGTISTTGATAIYGTSQGTITIGTQGSNSITSPEITGRVCGNAETVGNVIMYSGKVTATSSQAISSKGNITINGGSISATNDYGVIITSDSATITVTGGTITSESYAITTSNTTNGTIEITGGTITRTAGTDAAINNRLGTTTITGGTITSSGKGIYVTTGTITVGTNEVETPNVSITEPSITGATYGVQVLSGTFNFYDGIISGKYENDTGYSISKDPDNVPIGYGLTKINSESIETTTLIRLSTVTFNANGGEVDPTQKTVKYNYPYGVLPTPTRAGYTFNGWYTDQSEGTKVEDSTIVTNVLDHSIFAHWTIDTFTVTADATGGTIPATTGWTVASGSETATKDVEYNSTYGTLPEPTRTGYTFDGWYTEENGAGIHIQGTDTVEITLNTTLYAKWIGNTVTLTVDANSGTIPATTGWTVTNGNTIATKNVTYGDMYGTFPTPTKASYNFGGWYTDPTNGTQITSESIVEITENTILYAHWANCTAQIEGDATPYNTLQAAINAVSKTSNTPSIVHLYKDIKETITVDAGQKIIFDFHDHTLNDNATNVISNSGEITISNGTIKSSAGSGAINNNQNAILRMTGGSVIATGTRQAIYNDKGRVEISGTAYLSAKADVASNNKRGTIHNLASSTLIITGGTIVSTDSANGGIAVSNLGTATISGGLIETNNGTGIGVNNTGTATISGGTIEAKGTSGIGVSNSGTMTVTGGTIDAQGTSGKGISNTVTTLTIGADDGNINITSPIIKGTVNGVNSTKNFDIYDGIIKAKTNAISDETKAKTNTRYTLEHGTEVITGEEYKTVYLASNYIVTFNPTEGSVTNGTKKVHAGTAVGEMPVPTRTGFTFSGWYTQASEGDLITEETIINGDITLYAHWAKKIIITFDPNGGLIINGTKDAGEGVPIGELPTPTRDGFTFTGWYTDSEGGEPITPETIAGNSDITYYAQWILKTTAEMNGQIYNTLQAAIDKVPTNNTPVTINILEDFTEYVKTKANQNIILNLQNNTLSNNGVNKVIDNYGTLTIRSGEISSEVKTASTIDNYETGKVIVEGVNIITTGERQAIYNKGGIVEIKENSYISSTTTGNSPSGEPRGTLQNLAGGTITIENGTIVSTTQCAIVNEADSTVNLGINDGLASSNTPVVQGNTYGVKNSATFNFYDGIIKGITGTFNGAPTVIEEYYEREPGTETISSVEYHTEKLVYPIIIAPSTLEQTAAPITATITYSTSITSGQKAGFGATLAEAKANASAQNAYSVTITGNGYVYAEGVNGNSEKISIDLEISNITN